jgi:hypothetical protein
MNHALLTLLILLSLPSLALASGREKAERPFLADLHERIHPRWASFLNELPRLGGRYQDPALRTEVVLIIEADGAISGTEQPARAGLPGFDDAAVDVVRDLGKLPPPPPSLRSDDGRVYVRWRFQRKTPGCETSSIEERRLPLSEAVPRLLKDGRADEATARLRELKGGQPPHDLVRQVIEDLAQRAATGQDAAGRAAAAAVLAQLPAGEALLLSLIGDPEVKVQAAALTALEGRRLPLSGAVAPALKQLLNGELRVRAALLLHRLGDESGGMALRKALAVGFAPAETAAALLTLKAGAEAVQITAGLLESPVTQRAGALAAAVLGAPSLQEPLLALKGGPEDQRAAVVTALGAMGPAANAAARKLILRAFLDVAEPVRVAAAVASAKVGDRGRNVRYRLIDCLGDPAPAVRAAAAAALVQLGGEQAKDELQRPARDRALEVRLALLKALQEHPFPSAPQLLDKLLKDPEVAGAAALPAGTQVASRDEAVPAPAAAPRGRALIDEVLGRGEAVARLKAAAEWLVLP